MNLAELVEELVGPGPEGLSLWQRLATVSGRMPPGNGHPTAKSRPPATLTVVVLVMEITTAARESAADLAGRVGPDVPTNLRAIVDAVQRHDHIDDLTSWWRSSMSDWIERTRLALGQSQPLVRSVYGATCPMCSATVANVRIGNEQWSVPAIGIDWASDDTEHYEVHAVHCRACGLSWVRGLDLHELVRATLYASTTAEVLAVS